ncbi:MAG: DNA polymerase II small subunit, partial [Thermoplasmata archaeon]
DHIPDIFVTGHVHDVGADRYKGVTLINASAWQSQTSYQKMMNFIPTPARVPVVDLSTHKVDIMDFYT